MRGVDKVTFLSQGLLVKDLLWLPAPAGRGAIATTTKDPHAES
jgi:hypothetical protein